MLRALHTIHLPVQWHIHIRHFYKISVPEKQTLGLDKLLLLLSLCRRRKCLRSEELRKRRGKKCAESLGLTGKT